MILVATGLQREARILAGPDARVVAGGGDRDRLERELESAAGGVGGIISIGLCGALVDGLRPGDWVVGSEIFNNPLIPAKAGTQAFFEGRPPRDSREKKLGPRLRGDERNFEWAAALLKHLPGARSGPVLGSDTMIADPDAKRRAHEVTGALVVDMESHVAAAVASRHGLAFVVARVVSDAAHRGLPKAAQAGMASDGRMDLVAVLTSLAGDPTQLPALIRTGFEAEIAFRSLGRGRDLLGPGLGRPDFGELSIDVR